MWQGEVPMPAVMIEFEPAAFSAGGPLAAYADAKEKMRWVIQTGVRTAVHIDCNVWFRDNYPQPPNSLSIVVKGSHPSWIDTVDEFNRLEYWEVRAQIANAIERGILRVRGVDGNVIGVNAIRTGTLPTGGSPVASLDVSITT
jgi:hypothetical protein